MMQFTKEVELYHTLSENQLKIILKDQGEEVETFLIYDSNYKEPLGLANLRIDLENKKMFVSFNIISSKLKILQNLFVYTVIHYKIKPNTKADYLISSISLSPNINRASDGHIKKASDMLLEIDPLCVTDLLKPFGNLERLNGIKSEKIPCFLFKNVVEALDLLKVSSISAITSASDYGAINVWKHEDGMFIEANAWRNFKSLGSLKTEFFNYKMFKWVADMLDRIENNK